MSFTFDPLWKTLIDKKMNKEDLKKLTNISPSTIAKMSKNEYVALRVIDDICKVLNVESISEIIEFVPQNKNKKEVDELENLEKIVNSTINNPQFLPKAQKYIYKTLYSLLSKTQTHPNDNEKKKESLKIFLQCIENKLLNEKDIINLIKLI